ncbi:hypothetical protein like AT5G64040 [Hibiscus trionum]|uniref:Photosystem I reaction center subunit N, chloroplastic n=1 Tax=Hibiscus trionum TaxID=183268 RepID=A0A9W7GYL7_HIBTR|nr:hypothetical protein like AT5G64040 [Hibiscus trionum]
MAAMNSSVLACNYATWGSGSSGLNAKVPSVASPVVSGGHRLPVIRALHAKVSDTKESGGSEGRRAAILYLAAYETRDRLINNEGGNKVMVVVDSSLEAKGALDWAFSYAIRDDRDSILLLLHVAKPRKTATLFTTAAAASANAGVIDDYLEKSKANKELNDKKRLATTGANFARAYTVQFGSCKFPENFTGCQDLAKQKKVPFISDDLALECEGKDKYKCGSNVFWKR